jgi:signal transduction histidine kinase
VWTVCGAAPIRAPDGAVAGAVLTLGDVTRLREVHEQREDLSRMISHDLRTPLGVILAQAKLIGRRSEGPEAVRSRADAIVTSAQRMTAMLNDLVESALLEAGKLHLEREPVDLATMSRDLRGRLAAPYDGERIRIEVAAGVPRVSADPARLERVLVNLFTNALKYSEAGTEVVVRIGGDASGAVLEVEDRGPGIKPEDLPHLFERYFRALGHRRYEGMGLGLYTARCLVEAHGGTIAVASEPGRGSTFRVRLPTAAPGA